MSRHVRPNAWFGLKVYQRALRLATELFERSKRFPREETYSLIDQVRRASRGICTNIAEAYHKRQYPAHFVSKLSDSAAENAETSVWIDFSFTCKYITPQEHGYFIDQCQQVGRMLTTMIANPDRFLPRKKR